MRKTTKLTKPVIRLNGNTGTISTLCSNGVKTAYERVKLARSVTMQDHSGTTRDMSVAKIAEFSHRLRLIHVSLTRRSSASEMAYQCGRVFVQKPLAGCLFRGILSSRLKVPVVCTSHAAAIRENEDYEAKNIRLGRPQSPHLTIYKPQLTTMLSLTHRATGMAMGGIVTVWGIGGLFMSGHFSENVAALQNMHLSPALIILAKATLAFPLCYHYANGIRHLAWDFGKFLTIKEVYLTGYSVLAVSAVLTAFLASL